MTLLPKQLRIKTHVAVFDPADCSLRLLAISQLDRSFIPLQRFFTERDADFT